MRETLFNWLGGRVSGARCLDLFAGSGALGLEALSRGALHVTFVERDAVAVRELQARLTEWGATGAQVEHSDALRFLAGRLLAHDRGAEPFQIVFLDPPFAGGLLPQAAELLERQHWLAPEALIYVESSAREALPALPPAWSLVKAKQAGEVGYHLLVRTQPERGAGEE